MKNSRVIEEKRWAASFHDFAKPKTSLMSQTERGLTSEFGMGSGGSHALWPVTRLPSTAILFKRIGKPEILELHDPKFVIREDVTVYPAYGRGELGLGTEPLLGHISARRDKSLKFYILDDNQKYQFLYGEENVS
jgi:hypothetical protein